MQCKSSAWEPIQGAPAQADAAFTDTCSTANVGLLKEGGGEVESCNSQGEWSHLARSWDAGRMPADPKGSYAFQTVGNFDGQVQDRPLVLGNGPVHFAKGAVRRVTLWDPANYPACTNVATVIPVARFPPNSIWPRHHGFLVRYTIMSSHWAHDAAGYSTIIRQDFMISLRGDGIWRIAPGKQESSFNGRHNTYASIGGHDFTNGVAGAGNHKDSPNTSPLEIGVWSNGYCGSNEPRLVTVEIVDEAAANFVQWAKASEWYAATLSNDASYAQKNADQAALGWMESVIPWSV